MADALIPRIARALDFMVAVHAEVSNNDKASILSAARAELDTLTYDEVIALRESAFAMAAMCETRLLDIIANVNGNGEGSGQAATVEP